ncbi:GDP-6-deoxy-D-mannose reductase [Candidatus Magnetaquicoccaceae bacterium FCR-1]|uniref:GDP-6-deoxy-D-mannose reductase n=1 Tax=Candidatus Magnetaquiglobus chichijimensis TaxID=3141448 RepID=A0ABQ0C7S2_9PROT
MKIRVALTGARGWIGAGLAPMLEAHGADPLVLDGDMRTPESFDAAFDVLIHLASASREAFLADPEASVAMHRAGIGNALHAAARNRARLVFISTSGVYARDATGVLDEESGRIDPPHPYGQCKWQEELSCRAWSDTHGVPVRILRLFNVYGPGQSERFLIGYLVRQAMNGATIRLLTPQARRDFVHLADVRRAILLAALTPLAGVEICNVGSGVARSVLDVVAALQKRLATPLQIVQPESIVPATDQAIAAIDRIRQALGWSPAITLEQGIAGCLEEHASDPAQPA